MKRRRRQEGGGTVSEDDSMEQDLPPAKESAAAAAAAVVAEDATAPGQAAMETATATPSSQPTDGILPLETLIALPLVARWTPLSLRVRLWHNERRRTLSGDKRPKLADLPAFLQSHPQYRVHHDETRVLQVLELARDGVDGVHERHCAQCRSAGRPGDMIACQSCTYAWHRDCLGKPLPDGRTLVCDECIRRNPLTYVARYQKMLQQAQGQGQPLPPPPPIEPITVQIPKRFKANGAKNKPDAAEATNRRDSNGAGNAETPTAVVQQAPSAPPAGSETNVFSRENYRLLFNFLSKLMDNGFISKHEQGLMKNLIIARDAQAVLMLSIVDIVEEGGDLNDAVDSLRRILLVS